MEEQVNSHDRIKINRLIPFRPLCSVKMHQTSDDGKLVSIAYGELLLRQSEPSYIPTRFRWWKTSEMLYCGADACLLSVPQSACDLRVKFLFRSRSKCKNGSKTILGGCENNCLSI